MEKEIWKPIVEKISIQNSYGYYYPVPIYEVSNFGRIRNKNTDEIISVHGDGNRVTLYSKFPNTNFKEGLGYRLPRVIYATWCEDPGNKSVKHKDGNKFNNLIENLYI